MIWILMSIVTKNFANHQKVRRPCLLVLQIYFHYFHLTDRHFFVVHSLIACLSITHPFILHPIIFLPLITPRLHSSHSISSPPPSLSLFLSFPGQRSNACNTGQIRLFNVNESESLGPYMARYLGAKFYQGEQYYLQIDSHSEFVKDWDAKLIKMMEDAPARKPVISTYPPDRSSLALSLSSHYLFL